MAETNTTAGGVTVTTGEKTTGQKAVESIPVAGKAVKAYQEQQKVAKDGATQSEVGALGSEASAFVASLGGAAIGIATDPIGWLVGQGLDFLIAVVQPIEDAIHAVSGDGPALKQAGENFAAIGKGVEQLRTDFDKQLEASLHNWSGEASEAAGTKLGDFAKGIDGVAAQAGDLSEMLFMSSMVMSIIEDFIKALLTELITWLIMIWIPALAAAVPTAGASTASATAATGAKAAATGGKVARAIAKLRKVLDAIMEFLRKIARKVGGLKTGFRKAMDDKQLQRGLANLEVKGASKSPFDKPVAKLNSDDGMVGERLQKGFGRSMGDAALDTGAAQVGLGTGANAGVEKPLRNQSLEDAGKEADATGAEGQSDSETNRYLDI